MVRAAPGDSSRSNVVERVAAPSSLQRRLGGAQGKSIEIAARHDRHDTVRSLTPPDRVRTGQRFYMGDLAGSQGHLIMGK